MNSTGQQDCGTIIELDHQLIVSHLEDVLIFYFLFQRYQVQGTLLLRSTRMTPCQQLVCDSNSLQLLVCTPEFSDLANIMHEEGLLMPNSLDKARNLYNALISHIENIRTDKMHQ